MLTDLIAKTALPECSALLTDYPLPTGTALLDFTVLEEIRAKIQSSVLRVTSVKLVPLHPVHVLLASIKAAQENLVVISALLDWFATLHLNQLFCRLFLVHKVITVLMELNTGSNTRAPLVRFYVLHIKSDVDVRKESF